jgi:hypothetical protein
MVGIESVVALWNFFVLLHWTFWIGLVVFIATRKKWSWKIRASILSAIAMFFIFFVFIPMYQYYAKKGKEMAERKAYREKAYAYFHEQCAKDSGRFVYKPVETPQESVYIMKPRKIASVEDLKNQFWMGDPYMGAVYSKIFVSEKVGSLEELRNYIGSGDKYEDERSRITYFFSAEIPDLDDPNQLWRYAYEPTGRIKAAKIIVRAGKAVPRPGREVMKYPEKKLTRIPINAIQSRYGFTWEDLSTPESRQYWVAKSRLQIIDLQTHDVIAERIGYLIEGRSFGMGKRGWLEAWGGDNYVWKRHFCPSRFWGTDEDWIRSVLLNVPF